MVFPVICRDKKRTLSNEEGCWANCTPESHWWCPMLRGKMQKETQSCPLRIGNGYCTEKKSSIVLSPLILMEIKPIFLLFSVKCCFFPLAVFNIFCSLTKMWLCMYVFFFSYPPWGLLKLFAFLAWFFFFFPPPNLKTFVHYIFSCPTLFCFFLRLPLHIC